MIRTRVNSSNIHSIGHDPRTNTLEIQFKGGAIWKYHDVNPDEHIRLLNADSIGSHFASFIKPYKEGTQIQ